MSFFSRQRTPPDVPSFRSEALEHVDVLYRTGLRLTRSSSDAEDLVQDTFVRAFRFEDKFQPGTNLKAWLLRILTNTFINRYRRKVRERDALEGASAASIGDGVMSRAAVRGLTDAVEVSEQGLLREEIVEALDALPEDYRVMVILADVEELSYKEIAEAVDCPIGTVMSRLHRARKVLQQGLMAQAIQMGIVDGEGQVEGDLGAIDMESFRRRRQGVAG
jgi:RNA polymerase sigma-70 factor (ECF subfamily)